MDYSIPYDKSHIDFDMPSGFNVTLASPKSVSYVKNFKTSIREALENPINCPPLSELVKEKSSACIVVTDISRNCPDKEILPPLLETVSKEISHKNITILIASGMHREMTHIEKIGKYGKKIVDNYRIVDHDARDEKNLIYLGTTTIGTPIKLSKIAIESELLISTGVVEPHQYGGYSGGYKTVAIGIAGDETISYTHSTKMLRSSKIRPGNLEENCFHEDVVEIGRKAGLKFIVNVILASNNKILEVKAGEPYQTHQDLVKKAKSYFEVPVKKTFDVAVCGVGFPKDTNLYQASRAVSYLSYASIPVVKKGGYMIVPAKCEEGAGKGTGEKRFFDMLRNKTIQEILETKKELKAGEQRAFLMAKVLKSYKVIIVGAVNPEIVEKAKMIPTKTMEEAFAIVQNDIGSKLDVLILPDSMNTLPLKS